MPTSIVCDEPTVIVSVPVVVSSKLGALAVAASKALRVNALLLILTGSVVGAESPSPMVMPPAATVSTALPSAGPPLILKFGELIVASPVTVVLSVVPTVVVCDVVTSIVCVEPTSIVCDVPTVVLCDVPTSIVSEPLISVVDEP